MAAGIGDIRIIFLTFCIALLCRIPDTILIIVTDIDISLCIKSSKEIDTAAQLSCTVAGNRTAIQFSYAI